MQDIEISCKNKHSLKRHNIPLCYIKGVHQLILNELTKELQKHSSIILNLIEETTFKSIISQAIAEILRYNTTLKNFELSMKLIINFFIVGNTVAVEDILEALKRNMSITSLLFGKYLISESSKLCV